MPDQNRSMVTEEEALRRVGGYLRSLFEINELIYDITDKIARARSVDDLLAGLYAALRLQDKLKREKEKRNQSYYIPGEQDLSAVRRLAEAQQPGLRLVSRYIACLAMTYRHEGKED